MPYNKESVLNGVILSDISNELSISQEKSSDSLETETEEAVNVSLTDSKFDIFESDGNFD